MRALVYHGPKNVSVDEVPDARIEEAHRRSDQNHDDQHLRK